MLVDHAHGMASVKDVSRRSSGREMIMKPQRFASGGIHGRGCGQCSLSLG
jgi:hypothetical protein